MVRGDGLQLWDNDGKRYLDGMSGLWCTNLGYGRQDLAAAASRQLEQLPYYNMFFHTTHPAVVELSEMLFSLLPDHYSHAIYTNSGSEANEVLIRTVRRYWQILGKPQKKIMIGRWNGYHGSTLGSTALGGMKFMHEMGGMLPDFAHIDEPYWYANGIFGPVLAISAFDSEDEAIRLANDSRYGLAASLWSDDLHRAHRVARRLNAGTVSVNTVDALDVAVPFGGGKQSGFGRDLSLHSFDKYTQLKTTWFQLR